MLELQISDKNKILAVRIGSQAEYSIAAALKGAHIDVVQPSFDGVPQTAALYDAIQDFRKEAIEVLGEDPIGGRIDLASYSDVIQNVELPPNHYSYVLLLKFLDYPPVTRNAAGILAQINHPFVLP